MYRFLGPQMHAEELMRDRERLPPASSRRRLLFGGLAKGCQPRARSISALHRKEEKCSGYHHFTPASKDRLELQSAQMGGCQLSLSPTSTSSVDVYISNGSDDDSSGEQKKIILPRRHQSRRRFTWPERGRVQCGRQRHARSHGCIGSISCSECVKDKMERRKGEGGPRSKLKSRRKRAVVDHQGSDGVLCSSSAALTAAHLSLSGEKDVTAMATKVHETGPMPRGINHPMDDTEASNTPQKSCRKNVSCSDLLKPSSANFQPSVGGLSPPFTSAISSSNKKDTDLKECYELHTIESRIKALYQRATLGKEKLAMVLGQS